MDREKQKQVLEALILAAEEPIGAGRLADVVPGLTPARARELARELGDDYERDGRAFEVWEVAGGYQIRTRSEYSAYVRQLQKERPLRLSRAALETLAVIAYKQPVTRAEVEHVRGVDAGAVLRSLVERRLVRIAGHREVPGRPMLYGTSRRFLEVFGLSGLDDLPTLREIEELVPTDAPLEREDEAPAGPALAAEPAPASDEAQAPEGPGGLH